MLFRRKTDQVYATLQEAQRRVSEGSVPGVARPPQRPAFPGLIQQPTAGGTPAQKVVPAVATPRPVSDMVPIGELPPSDPVAPYQPGPMPDIPSTNPARAAAGAVNRSRSANKTHPPSQGGTVAHPGVTRLSSTSFEPPAPSPGTRSSLNSLNQGPAGFGHAYDPTAPRQVIGLSLAWATVMVLVVLLAVVLAFFAGQHMGQGANKTTSDPAATGTSSAGVAREKLSVLVLQTYADNSPATRDKALGFVQDQNDIARRFKDLPLFGIREVAGKIQLIYGQNSDGSLGIAVNPQIEQKLKSGFKACQWETVE